MHTTQGLLNWTTEQAGRFRRKAMVAGHRLQTSPLFSDEELISVLENHPRDQLQAFTMGTDPCKIHEWQPVDISGVSAKEVFSAIARGRLWVHVFRMQLFHAPYGELQQQLFSELSQICPDFVPFNASSTLLLSSPTALVYYHADPQFNLLWHVRGTKRVWSYPACDRELIDQQMMEDIFASYADEEVPYRSEFDRKAEVFDLKPGEVISWPLNAPHRVTNLSGLNVSLSTVYETQESYRRKLVYNANRYFRRSCNLPVWSTKEGGIGSYVKRSAFKALRRAGMVATPKRRAYVTNLRIDVNAPEGVLRTADGPVLTEFSKREFSLKKNAMGEVAAVPHKS